jgi:hypothetical protein
MKLSALGWRHIAGHRDAAVSTLRQEAHHGRVFAAQLAELGTDFKTGP